MKKYNCGCVYGDGRPYIIEYLDSMLFSGSPHWFLTGLMKSSTHWSKEQKDSYIINKRHETPSISFCLNGSKYWYVYSHGNNQVFADYGKYGENVWRDHENKRINFRLFCEYNLGLSLNSLDGLIEYMEKVNNKEIVPYDYFINTVQEEYRLSELFQLKVLNLDFMSQIVPRRYEFSFKDYINGGDGYPKVYESTIKRYNRMYNIKD